jgi:hypothetical protein
VIIHQTLYSLFPPSSFDPTLIAPLTPTEFIQRILVPEAAVGLILEDRELDPQNDKHKEKAVKILRESAAYGVAMFPDADTNIGGDGKGKTDDDWDMGVGDEIVRERARVRRKELEEEERMEEEWIKKEAAQAARNVSGKNMAGREERKVKGKRKGKATGQEVVEISETSDTGRLRPKARKGQRGRTPVDVDLTSDTSGRAKGRPAAARAEDDKLPKTRKLTERSADIDLCPSTDDTSERESGTKTKVKGKREASVDSMKLVYPDDMSVDGSDASSHVSSTTRRNRADKGNTNAKKSDSEYSTLLYPPTPSPPPVRPLKPHSTIVSLLSEDDEDTPRPRKGPSKLDGLRSKAPLSNTSSVASTIAKSSFPLQIARERRSEA